MEDGVTLAFLTMVALGVRQHNITLEDGAIANHAPVSIIIIVIIHSYRIIAFTMVLFSHFEMLLCLCFLKY